MLTVAECLADVDTLGLSKEVKDLFLGGNAELAFKI